MFCYNCGIGLPEEAAFCPNCGKPVYVPNELKRQDDGNVFIGKSDLSDTSDVEEIVNTAQTESFKETAVYNDDYDDDDDEKTILVTPVTNKSLNTDLNQHSLQQRDNGQAQSQGYGQQMDKWQAQSQGYGQQANNWQAQSQGYGQQANNWQAQSQGYGQQMDKWQSVGAQYFGPVPRRNTLYRYKCPKCGCVMNVYPGGVCSKCGTFVNIDFDKMGFIQIYRMGNFSGSLNGQGIYINNEPTGHIGNKETVIIALQPGTYRLHLAIGMTRNCTDRVLNVRPGEIIYLKSRIKMGVWKGSVEIVDAEPGSFPPLPG